MTEQLTLSLQPPPHREKEKNGLESLIARISQQRGSFNDVTEDGLESEIRKADTDKDFELNNDAEEEEGIDEAKAKLDEVFKAKEEMLRQVSQARNDTATALDFVSLLLSKYAPASGISTMSPYLKEHVPSASVGAETLQVPPMSDTESQSQEMISMGWRMQSLTTAADSLLTSATRLQKEIGKETTYWDQVLSIKEGGWSVCQLPREKHTLGVRYGFLEAHADFRDRGLAALRRDGEGALTLDRGPQSHRFRHLRVRILERGRPIASSTPSHNSSSSQGNSIAEQILHARDSIFDEELHLELHREARTLLGRGVRGEGSKVLLPYEIDQQIEVDLVEEEYDSLHLPKHVVSDLVAITLRILLSQAHRLYLRERSHFPAPLRGVSRLRPIYELIKPIISTLSEGGDLTTLLSEIVSGSAPK